MDDQSAEDVGSPEVSVRRAASALAASLLRGVERLGPVEGRPGSPADENARDVASVEAQGPARTGVHAERSLTPTVIETRRGIRARLSPDDRAVCVEDARGRVVFVLHDDGTGTFTAPAGDLELRSVGGRVRIEGDRGVQMRGPRIELTADHLRLRAAHLETTAKRIVEKAQDLFQDVERTIQVRAGDIRHTAQRTLLGFATKLRLRASEDAKVQAEKIYLG